MFNNNNKIVVRFKNQSMSWLIAVPDCTFVISKLYLLTFSSIIFFRWSIVLSKTWTLLLWLSISAFSSSRSLSKSPLFFIKLKKLDPEDSECQKYYFNHICVTAGITWSSVILLLFCITMLNLYRLDNLLWKVRWLSFRFSIIITVYSTEKLVHNEKNCLQKVGSLNLLLQQYWTCSEVTSNWHNSLLGLCCLRLACWKKKNLHWRELGQYRFTNSGLTLAQKSLSMCTIHILPAVLKFVDLTDCMQAMSKNTANPDRFWKAFSKTTNYCSFNMVNRQFIMY